MRLVIQTMQLRRIYRSNLVKIGQAAFISVVALCIMSFVTIGVVLLKFAITVKLYMDVDKAFFSYYYSIFIRAHAFSFLYNKQHQLSVSCFSEKWMFCKQNSLWTVMLTSRGVVRTLIFLGRGSVIKERLLLSSLEKVNLCGGIRKWAFYCFGGLWNKNL